MSNLRKKEKNTGDRKRKEITGNILFYFFIFVCCFGYCYYDFCLFVVVIVIFISGWGN